MATHEWGIAHEPNPFSKVRLPRIGGRRERRLRVGEFDQIAIAEKKKLNLNNKPDIKNRYKIIKIRNELRTCMETVSHETCSIRYL